MEKPGEEDEKKDEMTAEKYVGLTAKDQATWEKDAGYGDVVERIRRESEELTDKIYQDVASEVETAKKENKFPSLSDGRDFQDITAEEHMALSVRDKALYRSYMASMPDETEYRDQYQAMQGVLKESNEMRASVFNEVQRESNVGEEVGAGPEGIKMPSGLGKKFGDNNSDVDQTIDGQEFTPEGPVHADSHKKAGHFSVISTDGAALNRHTNDYLHQKYADNDTYKSISADLKEAEDAVTTLKAAREEQLKKEEEERAEEGERKKSEEAYQQELIELEKKRAEHESERRQFLANQQLDDKEKDALREHLTDALKKEYPNDLQPKEENGVDVYENASGKLNCKNRDDGMVELSVPDDSKFSGVVRVPRRDAQGNELDDCDMIEYKNGQAVSVVAGRQGQSAVVDFDKILGASKGKGGVQVSSKVEAEAATAGQTMSETENKAPNPEAEQAAKDVEVKMAVAGRMVGKASLAEDQTKKDEDKKALVEKAAMHLAEVAKKEGALDHTKSAGLENFTKEDRAKIVDAAKMQLSGTDKEQELSQWVDKNKVMEVEPTKQAALVAKADLIKQPKQFDAKKGQATGDDMDKKQTEAARKIASAVMKHTVIRREGLADTKSPSPTPGKAAGKAQQTSVAV